MVVFEIQHGKKNFESISEVFVTCSIKFAWGHKNPLILGYFSLGYSE